MLLHKTHKKVIGFLAGCFAIVSIQAQTTLVEWQNVYGGNDGESTVSIIPTPDGGYMVAASSYSPISGNKTEASFLSTNDYWVLKLDADRNIIWQNNIGSDGEDYLYAFDITDDGGCILAGYSDGSASGDKSENTSIHDYWIVKLTNTGAIEWENTIIGTIYDEPKSIYQTSDGGFILGGSSSSGIGFDKTEAKVFGGYFDMWVMKLSATGNIVWQNSIGGNGSDECYDLIETTDGGYLLVSGTTTNISADKTVANYGSNDIWMVKLTSAGVIDWQKDFGGTGYDTPTSVKQTPDGGYAILASSNSGISGMKSEPNIGNYDIWMLKTDAFGNLEWQNTIGGTGYEYPNDLSLTSDNGYLISASTESSISGDKTEALIGVQDVWILKLDNAGAIDWQNAIGTTSLDYAGSIYELSEGGYLIGASGTTGISGDKTLSGFGSTDVWMVKLCDAFTFYADADSDGYGDATATTLACSLPFGYVENNTDCDDSHATVFPGASEICDGLDNDCNSLIDDALTFTTYYFDNDVDGFGDATNSVSTCDGIPGGYVNDNTDCNDASDFVYPGATEICDGIDNDCDGDTDEEIATAVISPVGPVIICKGEPETLFANTGAGYTYQWFKNGNVIIGATSDNYAVSKPAYYQVEVTIPGGCSALSEYVAVGVNPAPNANISAPLGTSLCDLVKLKASFNATYTWQWYRNGDAVSGATNYLYIPTSSGDYYCNVTTAEGCSRNTATLTVTDCKEASAISNCELSVYPNPANDYINVNMTLQTNADNAELQIVNVMGQLIIAKNIAIQNGQIESTIQIDEITASGMYWVKVIVGNSVYTRQIAVQQ